MVNTTNPWQSALQLRYNRPAKGGKEHEEYFDFNGKSASWRQQ